MKLSYFAFVLAIFATSCTTKAAPEPARKPGFLERAWTSTQKGSGRIWNSAKTGVGKGLESTKELITSPFSKNKLKNPVSSFRQLEVAVRIKPEGARLSTTHSLETTVLITNSSDRSVQLSFPTSQRVEIVMKTEDGKVIQRWSDDQRIEREPSFIAINPRERLEYLTTLSTRNMVAGKTYTIEASMPGYDAIFGRKVIVPQN